MRLQKPSIVLATILIVSWSLLSCAPAAPITLTDMFVACRDKETYRQFIATFKDKNINLEKIRETGKMMDARITLGLCHRFFQGDKVYVESVKNELSCVRLDSSKVCFWAVTATVR